MQAGLLRQVLKYGSILIESIIAGSIFYDVVDEVGFAVTILGLKNALLVDFVFLPILFIKPIVSSVIAARRFVVLLL